MKIVFVILLFVGCLFSQIITKDTGPSGSSGTGTGNVTHINGDATPAQSFVVVEDANIGGILTHNLTGTHTLQLRWVPGTRLPEAQHSVWTVFANQQIDFTSASYQNMILGQLSIPQRQIGVDLPAASAAPNRFFLITNAANGGTCSSTGTARSLCWSNGTTYEALGGGGGSGSTIQDEGTPLIVRPNLNFTGLGVTCTDDAGGSRTNCNIPAAGSNGLFNTRVNLETPGGVKNGINKVYTLSQTPVTGSLRFFRNGDLLHEGASYDFQVSGSMVTLNAGYPAPVSDDNLQAEYDVGIGVWPTTTVDNTIPRFDGVGGSIQSSLASINDTGKVISPIGFLATCAPLPGSPVNGDIVCDSADNLVKVRSNGVWITVGSFANAQPRAAQSPAFNTTMVFSFNYSRIDVTMSGNITACSFSDLVAGSHLYISFLQDGTGNRTKAQCTNEVNYCSLSGTAGIRTTQEYVVDPNGTTVHGVGCTTDHSYFIQSGPTGSAPANPPPNHLIGWFDSTNGYQTKDPTGIVKFLLRSVLCSGTDKVRGYTVDGMPVCEADAGGGVPYPGAPGIVVGTSPGTSAVAGESDIENALGSQSANCIFAAPNGSVGQMTCRASVKADLPSVVPYLDQPNTYTAGQKQVFTANVNTAGIKAGCAALPSSPENGDIVCDSGDSNKVKVYSNGAWITVAVGGGTDRSLIISSPGTTISSGATEYLAIGSTSDSATRSARETPMPAAGTLSNLRIRTTGTQPAGADVTCTVLANGAALSPSLSIRIAPNDTIQTYLDSDSAAVSAGDLVTLECTNSGATTSVTISSWTMLFTF